MSKQPWELRDSDERKADTKLIFIIFCEDKNSEPIYFKYFETPKIKVNLVKEQDSGMRHVLKAIKRCKDDRLMEYNENGELELTDEEVHIWCVFDMDLDINNESRDNISFDEGIQLAEGKGIKVAWSNDAFELWVLLHFNEINPELPENKLRDTYYDNLTKIFSFVLKLFQILLLPYNALKLSKLTIQMTNPITKKHPAQWYITW